ncbi:MAG: adenylate/guanylate cyclase domain-containing protein [Candidatus Limnocylindrales bacterium]
MTEVQSPTSAAQDPVQAGREAISRHEWALAFEQFTKADVDDRLTGPDLEGLAVAAFFIAKPDVALDAKERAFKLDEAGGDHVRAAYLALDIAAESFFAGKPSIASAWTRRAERILGPEGETYAHGYLALIRSYGALGSGDLDGALALAERAVAIGTKTADADLKAHALASLGSLKIATGHTSDGFALMEEAAMSAVSGELSPVVSGVTACQMISACRDLTDYRRASEWIEATEKYCAKQAVAGFPGVCRVHRAEVAAVHGAWGQAELDLERATDELGAYAATPPQADGFYAIGDIRRLKGDFEGAEAALREAHARGKSPQPALALIRLAEGKVRAALTAIDAALAEGTWDRLARTRLLPAQVEILIAAGDIERARKAVDDLTGIVADYPSMAFEAGRQIALGRVLLAEGDSIGAAHELRVGIKGWREVGAPYEVGRGRIVLSHALRAIQDEEGADLELQAALDEFRHLGARVDIEVAERELRDIEDRRKGPQTARRTFMFTDIVGSTSLAEALGDQAWERLLRWHDDMLRGLVVSGGGVVVNSTGDGFFITFDSARAGLDCAIAIQRALAEHRETTGFALSVRIGLHTTDANQRGSDYSGRGVHIAARVAALAGAGEILATAETLGEAGDAAASATRAEQVKGVSEPVSLAVVPWAA